MLLGDTASSLPQRTAHTPRPRRPPTAAIILLFFFLLRYRCRRETLLHAIRRAFSIFSSAAFRSHRARSFRRFCHVPPAPSRHPPADDADAPAPDDRQFSCAFQIFAEAPFFEAIRSAFDCHVHATATEPPPLRLRRRDRGSHAISPAPWRHSQRGYRRQRLMREQASAKAAAPASAMRRSAAKVKKEKAESDRHRYIIQD